MAKPILVTGFEAFGEHELNVSESVAKSLEGMDVRGHKIRSLVLSVDFEGSNRVACMLEEEEFAAILHIGLAANSAHPRIEIRARDILDFRIPDNSGRQAIK